MSQQRLRRVQLANWGTFDGIRSFDVPRRGLLLTGPSGAGKSSVLDAMASILVKPAKLRFNAAAQGTETGDRERSLVTYVRGAHKRETDSETGEVATAFLRRSTTWSGVALTFDDAAGTVTTLVRLFHLRAASTTTNDLKTVYAIVPGRVELSALAEFAKDGIENRRIKASHPDWDVYGNEDYSRFAAKFVKRLRMGSEQAQLLLHKTQSAKNLTNLDSLFRDFMLDEPETFDTSQQTVEQFGELSDAHKSVVDARRQVEALVPLRGFADARRRLTEELERVEAEQRHLETWLRGRELAGHQRALPGVRGVLEGLDSELARAEDAVQHAESERVRAQRAVDGSAGAQLETLEELMAQLRSQIAEREHRRADLAGAAQGLELSWPGEGERPAFEARMAELAVEIGDRLRRHKDEQYEASAGRASARAAVAELADALEALRRHRSNLDPRLLAARELLAERLQVAETTLPFVGELIQVRPEQSEWAGAIERVLGGFARTLVVPEPHYRAAAEIVDAQYLNVRLVYEVPRVPGSPAPEPGERSLVGKVELAEGPHREWVADRLRRRFDYAAVADSREFARHDRAVTRAGQVKHSSALHEKDDRSRVDDRSRWVLGFSTEAKEAELVAQLAAAERRVEAAELELERLDEQGNQIRARELLVGELGRIDWAAIDTTRLAADLADRRAAADALKREHVDLDRLRSELDAAVRAAGDAEASRRGLASKRDAQQAKVRASEERIEQLVAEIASSERVPDEVAERLTADAAALNVRDDRLERELGDGLRQAESHLTRQRSGLERQIVRTQLGYRKDWPAQSADWSDDIAYLPEFLQRLDDLERDRLPEFEARFFGLLQNQARNNISQLSAQVRGAKREIRSRVDEVNKSLRMTEFSPGGYLQIDVRNRALPDVDQFLATLGEITSSSLDDIGGTDTAEDRAAAERRFELMKALLDRLGSAEPSDKVWRDRVLDTRQHVSFQASVLDEDGVQLDVFTGSGGRSGGERQKLVTFCLAAALRFQLAPSGRSEPSYGLVVIDEAFDKADHTFTRAGLEVFKTFGFQLLLATPLKMLQTIEDYVGGVVMVSNASGKGSVIEQLPFDTDDESRAEDADEPAQEALM